MILALPRKRWTGQDWAIPRADLKLLHQTFGGLDLRMAPEVEALCEPAPRLAPGFEVVDVSPEPVVTDYVFKTTPFKHQVKAFDLARRRRYFAFLMEMGTGKTKAIIDVVSYLIQKGKLDGVLIFCPKAVLYNWEREIEIHSPLEPHARRAVVITGNAHAKTEALQRGFNTCTFFITNYETVLRMEPELNHLLSRKRFAIICDESTEIKSPKAKTTKAIRKLGLTAQARYILTGSPVTQSPLDAFSQFCFLDKNILGHVNFTSFKAEYSLTMKRKGIPLPLVVGYRNLDRMAKLIAPHSYRVLKKDCLDLPPKVYKTVELEMGTRQKELYLQMRDEAVIEIEGQTLAAPVILTKILRLQQIASGFLPIHNEFGELLQTKHIEDSPKLPACRDLVAEALESGQKVIIWCRFLWEIDQLAACWGDAAVLYYGERDATQRQAAVDSFQTDPRTKIFIGQIQTGGIGITLTAASQVIYYSNSFSLADRLQSEDRAHRIGQTKSVGYNDLVCRGSVDKLVLKALRDKKNLADLITGDNLKQLFYAE